MQNVRAGHGMSGLAEPSSGVCRWFVLTRDQGRCNGENGGQKGDNTEGEHHRIFVWGFGCGGGDAHCFDGGRRHGGGNGNCLVEFDGGLGHRLRVRRKRNPCGFLLGCERFLNHRRCGWGLDWFWGGRGSSSGRCGSSRCGGRRRTSGWHSGRGRRSRSCRFLRSVRGRRGDQGARRFRRSGRRRWHGRTGPRWRHGDIGGRRRQGAAYARRFWGERHFAYRRWRKITGSRRSRRAQGCRGYSGFGQIDWHRRARILVDRLVFRQINANGVTLDPCLGGQVDANGLLFHLTDADSFLLYAGPWLG